MDCNTILSYLSQHRTCKLIKLFLCFKKWNWFQFHRQIFSALKLCGCKNKGYQRYFRIFILELHKQLQRRAHNGQYPQLYIFLCKYCVNHKNKNINIPIFFVPSSDSRNERTEVVGSFRHKVSVNVKMNLL